MPSNRSEEPLIARFAWNGVNPSLMYLSPPGMFVGTETVKKIFVEVSFAIFVTQMLADSVRLLSQTETKKGWLPYCFMVLLSW